MFRSRLGYLDGTVAHVGHLLCHPLHLIAEDEGIALAGSRPEIFQHDGSFGLFYGERDVSLPPERFDGFGRTLEVLPCDGIFGAEGRLVNFAGGGSPRYAAQQQPFYGESVACSEEGTDIVQAPYIVEYDRHGHFAHAGILFCTRTVQFFVGGLFHLLSNRLLFFRKNGASFGRF